jgi:hypothetical protein
MAEKPIAQRPAIGSLGNGAPGLITSTNVPIERAFRPGRGQKNRFFRRPL